jgi:hypothetical protein
MRRQSNAIRCLVGLCAGCARTFDTTGVGQLCAPGPVESGVPFELVVTQPTDADQPVLATACEVQRSAEIGLTVTTTQTLGYDRTPFTENLIARSVTLSCAVGGLDAGEWRVVWGASVLDLTVPAEADASRCVPATDTGG